MKGLIAVVGFVLLVPYLPYQSFADEHSALARVTVYWHREGSGERAAWNGTRLREGHCAIDPKKIPYGSKVIFLDAECVAVDSGPDVVTRKAARSCGRNAAERKAIVIDRFFHTKQKAVAWAKAPPHFMTVQIRTPGTKIAVSKNPRPSRIDIASSLTISWLNDFHQGFATAVEALVAALTL